MEMNFCRRCGTKLTKRGERVLVCENDHLLFLNPSPTASIVLLEGENLLMSVRAIDPNKGMLDFFGGFMELDENVEEAAHREIAEETGLSSKDYGPLTYLGSYAATYEYGGERNPIVSIYFYADVRPGAVITPNDDSSDVVRMPLFDVDWTKISGEDTKLALKDLQRMKQK